jgi:hypothetical protein
VAIFTLLLLYRRGKEPPPGTLGLQSRSGRSEEGQFVTLPGIEIDPCVIHARNPVPRWPVTGSSGYSLTSSQPPGKQRSVADCITFPHILRNGVYPRTPAGISALVDSVIAREGTISLLPLLWWGHMRSLIHTWLYRQLSMVTGQGVIVRDTSNYALF